VKTIKLQREVQSFYFQNRLNLNADICEVTLRPFAGEWVLYTSQSDAYIGFANTTMERPSFFMVKRISKEETKLYLEKDESEVASEIIKELLTKSIHYRLNILPYGEHARMVYGVADFLPGLIIDSYVNLVMVQINTAGLDRFRKNIEEILQKFFPSKKIFFLDNEQQRKKEGLPLFDKIEAKEALEIVDGKLQLEIQPSAWQKNGYYYDHRDNRLSFYQKLTDLKLELNNGLDLFCYLGSWGMTALKAGVKNFDFVDQANLKEQFDVNLQKNHLMGRGSFHHSDVFNFLDQKIREKAHYDVVVSDPPSFAKSLDKKPQAIQGYKKLHKKIFQVLKSSSVVCFASCTHYVSAQEFESTIMDAALSERKKLKLIDTGIQALDHPFVNFNDKSYYLKYFVYLLSE
jgi:23S rRNA (cytosine1962-C5)-methyltransferase